MGSSPQDECFIAFTLLILLFPTCLTAGFWFVCVFVLTVFMVAYQPVDLHCLIHEDFPQPESETDENGGSLGVILGLGCLRQAGSLAFQHRLSSHQTHSLSLSFTRTQMLILQCLDSISKKESWIIFTEVFIEAFNFLKSLLFRHQKEVSSQ